jgi:ribosomal protein L14
MIGNGTQLQVTDNSGAKVAQCINQSGKSWGIGDVITVSIKKAQPRSKVAAGQVSSGFDFVQDGALTSMNHASPAGTRD